MKEKVLGRNALSGIGGFLTSDQDCLIFWRQGGRNALSGIGGFLTFCFTPLLFFSLSRNALSGIGGFLTLVSPKGLR